jgi:hypothetical protein
VYAHIFDWPKSHELVLAGVTKRPRAVYLLADREPLAVEQRADGLVVKLPAVPPSRIDAVLVLETGAATSPAR